MVECARLESVYTETYRRFKSCSLRQEQPHSNMWLLYFCHKGVAGIVIPTQVVEQRRSSHWKTLKRDKGTWTK